MENAMPKIYASCVLALAVCVLPTSVSYGKGSYAKGLPPGQTAKENFDSGVEAFQKADYDGAITAFTVAIRFEPGFVNAYYNRGLSYSRRGEHADAIDDYSEALRLDPRNAAVYSARARSLGEQGDLAHAIADYTKAIQLQPNDPWLYYDRGMSFSLQGEYEDALADFNAALRLNPNNASLHYQLGIAHANQSDYDHALADFSEAIRLDPKFAPAYVKRGIIHELKEQSRLAIADYTEALRLEPGNALAQSRRAEAARTLAAEQHDQQLASSEPRVKKEPEASSRAPEAKPVPSTQASSTERRRARTALGKALASSFECLTSLPRLGLSKVCNLVGPEGTEFPPVRSANPRRAARWMALAR